jgi:ABC-type dipeptide/oligopeptide/nickel transport system permease subunit
VVVALVLLAVGAPLVSGDPLRIDLDAALQPPSFTNILGTDVQGRDVWSRLVYGARVSLLVGIVSQGIALSLGVVLGLVAGYYGRWIDETVMRLADVTLAFPSLLLLIAMSAAFSPSLTVVCVTIGVVGWAGMARLVRGQVLVVRELEYVQAMRAIGARDTRILLRHVLPNVAAPVLIAVTLGVAGAVMAEAALSFLGLGVQPPTPSWGVARRGPRSHPDSPSGRRCLASICSATPCATRPIRGTECTGPRAQSHLLRFHSCHYCANTIRGCRRTMSSISMPPAPDRTQHAR